jgi:hypothetical protein
MSTPIESPLSVLLTRDKAAVYIGVQVSTLAAWAHTDKHRDILPQAHVLSSGGLNSFC